MINCSMFALKLSLSFMYDQIVKYVQSSANEADPQECALSVCVENCTQKIFVE